MAFMASREMFATTDDTLQYGLARPGDALTLEDMEAEFAHNWNVTHECEDCAWALLRDTPAAYYRELGKFIAAELERGVITVATVAHPNAYAALDSESVIRFWEVGGPGRFTLDDMARRYWANVDHSDGYGSAHALYQTDLPSYYRGFGESIAEAINTGDMLA